MAEDNIPVVKDKEDISNEILVFVTNLFKDTLTENLNPKEIALAATYTADYLRIVRDMTSVQASLGLPATVEAITLRAKSGDLEAAKLLLSLVGVMDKGKNNPQNAIQINITSTEQAILEGDFKDEQ